MPLIVTRKNATEEEINALLEEYSNDPAFEYRGGYGQLCGFGKIYSGFNYLSTERGQYVSIEIDRPQEAGRGSTVVRLYVDALI